MKLFFIILVTAVFSMSFEWKHSALKTHAISNQSREEKAGRDSSQSIRITNASKLKRLPAVIRDLSSVFNDPLDKEALPLGENGLSIYLYDVTCSSFEHSAAVLYQLRDTVYRLKLNRFNDRATDKALAATLIHEIMHCVLLDIYSRAKREEEQAMKSIVSFGLNENDSTSFFNNDFFALMNTGDEGQHELIYQLFYPQMVSLLEQFCKIHKESFFDDSDSKHLLWSGLQNTIAYEKLAEEEKKEIELAILTAKGINIEHVADVYY